MKLEDRLHVTIRKYRGNYIIVDSNDKKKNVYFDLKFPDYDSAYFIVDSKSTVSKEWIFEETLIDNKKGKKKNGK